MDADRSRAFGIEAHLSNHLQQHFLKQRKMQKQRGEKMNITNDIACVMEFVAQKCQNPVVMLKSMGMMFLGKTAAFNMAALNAQLVCCRSLAVSALHREGWKDVKENQDTGIGSMIGVNNVKKWVVMSIPTQSKVAEVLASVPKLVARESSLELDRQPREILIASGMPPPEELKEPHFPLVSIQYELALEPWSIADIAPARHDQPERRMEIVNCGSVDIDYEVNL